MLMIIRKKCFICDILHRAKFSVIEKYNAIKHLLFSMCMISYSTPKLLNLGHLNMWINAYIENLHLY